MDSSSEWESVKADQDLGECSEWLEIVRSVEVGD